ncbi:TetR/AcrR family transcriptional regulator [Bradyrhizobium sp. CIR3A]|uniref:TetR/AcrR family transcriptional regulator n=1 Tax=Bradyrhizobium sp. CIR3A TaxID=2663838 RepID=UPI00160616D9|nr:TetR/AcrR family transcriptional regulator [Bradyrhizobium sp. CIR3A]MBB4262808.1 AcrR family transcriptional regulator [Bradyrhizobium sp. CIR3A]
MHKKSSRSLLEPRKKPVQARSAATVATIIEAAACILEQRGLADYTTNAIANLAGVSPGSIYQYFPSRDAITRALIERETDLLLGDFSELNAFSSGREGLGSLIGAMVNRQLKRPTLTCLLNIERKRLFADDRDKRLKNELVRIVLSCLERSDLPATARHSPAAADLIAIIGGIVDSAAQRGDANAPLLISRVRRTIFGYLQITCDGLE